VIGAINSTAVFILLRDKGIQPFSKESEELCKGFSLSRDAQSDLIMGLLKQQQLTTDGRKL